MTRCETSKPRCALSHPSTPVSHQLSRFLTYSFHAIYPHVPPFFFFLGKQKTTTKIDPGSAPSSAAPPLAPHPCWSAPPRRYAACVLARHARRTPAARRDKRQGRCRRPVIVITRCNRCASGGAMAALFRRRDNLRWRGRGRNTDPGASASLRTPQRLMIRRTAHASPPARTIYICIYLCILYRRRKSSLYAALTASVPQASPKMTSSTFEGSSTRAQPRTISLLPNSRQTKNVRLPPAYSSPLSLLRILMTREDRRGTRACARRTVDRRPRQRRRFR
jgi:hypothetical protein